LISFDIAVKTSKYFNPSILFEKWQEPPQKTECVIRSFTEISLNSKDTVSKHSVTASTKTKFYQIFIQVTKFPEIFVLICPLANLNK